MPTSSTTFKFAVEKTFNFNEFTGKYIGKISVSINLADGKIPSIIQTSQQFMDEVISPTWGWPYGKRTMQVSAATSEEIKQLVDERVEELIEQLRAIYRNNVASMRDFPKDSVTEITWDSIS